MSDKTKAASGRDEGTDNELCSAIGELSQNITQLSEMVAQLQRALTLRKNQAEKAAAPSSCTIH